MSMDKSLEAISKLYSKYEKQGSVYMPPETLDSVESDAERLKSPYLSLDRYLGGGPALGKITTYSGFFSTGKTSLALALAGHNKDKTIGFIDAEYNWSDSSYLWIDKYFGIEKERIHVMHPVYLEEAAEMIEDMCDALDVVIYDGFDMVAPKGEYQGSMEDNTMGLMARSYKKFFRRSMGKIYKTNTALIITNHLYENVGNVYEPYKEPGGRAISDYASQKLYLTTGKLKQGEEVVGQKVRFNIKKDKLNGNKDLKFEMEYNREFGFDIFVDIINNAEELGVMTKKGSWYYYDGSTIGQGKQKTADILVDNPELVEEIVGRCKELF